MKYHEHNQQCFTVLHAPAPPPADRSSPEHEHNSAPWFMSVSIYPFKKNWTTVRTNLHDNLLKLSSGNAETPSHRGMHRSDRKTSEKWVQMMQCVKFLWSWILCAWKFLSLFFDYRKLSSQLLTEISQRPAFDMLLCNLVERVPGSFGCCSAWIIQDR